MLLQISGIAYRRYSVLGLVLEIAGAEQVYVRVLSVVSK